MNQSHFFVHLSRLKLISRWPLMRNVRTENVSEHSLQVAMVAHALAAIKNRKFGGSVNAERIALLAMYHDAGEVLTGDLPTPVKYFNSQIAHEYNDLKRESNMSKVIFSKSAIISLADYVLKNYGHISETIEAGIIATQKTYSNSKLTALAVYDMLQTTAKYMQAVENEGVLKGVAKKEAVLEFIVKEYLETQDEIKQIWSGWRTTVSWFIDQLISMLNSGRHVLQAFVG